MKTKVLSRKTRITAIITAFALLLTALWTVRPTFASAEYWNVPPFNIDPDHVCTDSCYQNIYYLTDNMESENYVNGFLGDLVDMYAEQHTAFNEFKYYDIEAVGTLAWQGRIYDMERFGDPAFEYETNPAHDALVIYELNELLPIQFADNTPYVPTSRLYNIFLRMKQSNCRIMFICNTNEKLYNNHNVSTRFLDLVDVHVNMDLYSSFTRTFLTLFTQDSIEDTTIILDECMSFPAVIGTPFYYENEYKYTSVDMSGEFTQKYGNRRAFIDATLMPCIKKTLGSAYRGMYACNADLLKDHKINILCYLGCNAFYDLTNNDYFILNSAYPSLHVRCGSNKYYFVGSTLYGNSFELRNLLMEIEENDSIEFDRYLYVEHGPCYKIPNEKNMHDAGLNENNRIQFISPIATCFLFEELYTVDLSTFNNWSGRCDVTAHPTSDDTWLLPWPDPIDSISLDEEEEYYEKGY